MFVSAMLAASAAHAVVVRERVHRGVVTAELTWNRTSDSYGFRTYSRTHIVIRRGRRILVNRLLRSPFSFACRKCAPQPANGYKRRRSIALRNLDRDARPEIVADLFSGGAHCCFFSVIYDYVPKARAYRKRIARWFDAGYRLREIEHRRPIEFVTGDARFAYKFTSFADSAFPIRIFHLTNKGLRAVTSSFPNTVRRDAHRWFAAFEDLDADRDPRGVLAAYAADKAILGEADEAFDNLNDLADEGYLSGYGSPAGRAYVAALKRFLRKLHYPL